MTLLSTRNIASVTMALAASAGLAQPTPVTNAMLNGPWELQTICMNIHGKPAGCSPAKAGSLRLVFTSAGTWRIAVPDPTEQMKSGLYEIRKEDLLLRNADGSLFQDWRMDYSSDGRHLVITNKKNIQTFERVTTTTE